MREKWVRRIILLTGLLVLLLSATFAVIQNTSDITGMAKDIEQEFISKPETSHMLDPNLVEAGRKIYIQASCSSCHAIGGKGYPRNSLDNVGAKYTPEELRNWITGSEILRGVLPDHTLNLKQKYRTMPEGDLKALIIYLQSI